MQQQKNRKQQQQKQHHKQQQTAKAAAKATRTARKTSHNKKSQHQAATTMAKTAQKTTKAVHTFWKVKAARVCFSHNRGKQRQIKAKRCGPRRVVGGEEGASSRGYSVGYRQILSQLVEVRRLQSIVKKTVIYILEGQTLQGGGEGGSTVGGPEAATRKAANKQQNQEQHKQHKQQPRKSEGQEVPKVGEGVVPWNFGFRGFFLDAKQNCNNWFGSLVGCKSIVKMFLTFCESHRGFTQQPESPNVHI